MTLVLMIIFFWNIYSRLGAHWFCEPVQTVSPVIPEMMREDYSRKGATRCRAAKPVTRGCPTSTQVASRTWRQENFS